MLILHLYLKLSTALILGALELWHWRSVETAGLTDKLTEIENNSTISNTFNDIKYYLSAIISNNVTTFLTDFHLACDYDTY